MSWVMIAIAALLIADKPDLSNEEMFERQLSDVGSVILSAAKLDPTAGKRCIEPKLTDVAGYAVDSMDEGTRAFSGSGLNPKWAELLSDARRNENSGSIPKSDWPVFRRLGYEILTNTISKKDWQGCDVVFRPRHPVVRGDHALVVVTQARKDTQRWATTPMFFRRAATGWDLVFKGLGYTIVS